MTNKLISFSKKEINNKQYFQQNLFGGIRNIAHNKLDEYLQGEIVMVQIQEDFHAKIGETCAKYGAMFQSFKDVYLFLNRKRDVENQDIEEGGML